ncbi:hypothetical protein SSPIM334S_08559 [Streptomyces spiroverticillatus]
MQERPRDDHAHHRAPDHHDRRPLRRGLDERVRHQGQRNGRERGPQHVEPAVRLRIPRLRYVPQRDGHAQRGQRHVDQERPPPAGPVHQPPAQERADGRPDPAQPRPQPHGPRPVVRVEGSLDERERPRCEQGPADPLQRPCGNQHRRVGREPAHQRRHGEPHHPHHEHLAPPVPVPERPAQQDQPGQRQHVRVDGPLEPGEIGPEVLADAGQGDVDDGRVQHRHARPEHGGEQHPPPGRTADPQSPGTLAFGHTRILPALTDSGQTRDTARGTRKARPPPDTKSEGGRALPGRLTSGGCPWSGAPRRPPSRARPCPPQRPCPTYGGRTSTSCRPRRRPSAPRRSCGTCGPRPAA